MSKYFYVGRTSPKQQSIINAAKEAAKGELEEFHKQNPPWVVESGHGKTIPGSNLHPPKVKQTS